MAAPELGGRVAVESHIEFQVWGRNALFTDPLTKVGGEKFSYQIPTYEALKGIAKSVYWKPTFTWYVDDVRVMKRIQTQTKGTKPLNFGGGDSTPRNSLAIYTFLTDVEYQVRAHFEWNQHRPELADDRNPAKHLAILERMLERGGRQDIFLGTRDCQGYVEPCPFGAGRGAYDNTGDIEFGLMFHGFDYPDETGSNGLQARFWRPVMTDGVIRFPPPAACTLRKFIRSMEPKQFVPGASIQLADVEAQVVGVG
jgi:CRISPR-associated protein Cas5d